jgi:2-(1,2-epoxy-1,2-dihydrophenyl)acetyl-CoA isomerase
MTDESSAVATVLFDVADGIAAITLNRPEVANAIRADQRDWIIRLLADASADKTVRCVVISAVGKQFCSGADVSGIANQEIRAGSVTRTLMEGAQRLIAAVLDCEKPVIAAVQGSAAGLGAHLAFASDLIVASADAAFIEVFVKRGITLDAGGAYLLARRMGLQRAKELVFFGDRLPAQDAASLGLVNRVVAAEDLAQTTRELALRLAGGPTVAVTMAKRLLNRSLDSDRQTAFIEEAMAQEITMNSADAIEGVKAFKERRAPEFKGF